MVCAAVPVGLLLLCRWRPRFFFWFSVMPLTTAHVRPRRVVLIRREITSSCFIYSVSDDCPLFVGRRERGPGEELES